MESLQAAAGRLDELRTTILGISADAPEALARFHAARGLGFGLLSDRDKVAIGLYAAYHGWLPLPGRATFILDSVGVVRRVWRRFGKLANHGDAVAAAVAELQARDSGRETRSRRQHQISTTTAALSLPEIDE